MTQPVSGTTTFDNLSGPLTNVGASAASPGLTASNVDGWNITLLAVGSAPDSYIYADAGEFGGTITIDGDTTDGASNFESLSAAANDGSRFTLTSVDVGIAVLSNGQPSGSVELIGYRNGVAVSGATETLTVNDDGSLTTFDVSGNSAFQGITSFTLETDGTYFVQGSFGLDNIVASGFQVSGPVFTTTSTGAATFTQADNTASTPITIDPNLALSDATSSTFASATVAITGNFAAGQDVLALQVNAGTGDISGSYNSGTGVLTLTSASGNATQAQWQAAFDAVTYTDTAANPSTLVRTVTFTANDGTDIGSSTRGISVAATDQTPIVTTSATTASYVGTATPVTIDAGLTVADANNATLASATVSIGAGFTSGDALGFTPGSASGNIAASYNATTGLLALTSAGATATLAQWQAALDSITFSSNSSVAGNRTISFVVNDGTTNSLAQTDTVNLRVGATVATDSGAVGFIEADNAPSVPVTIDSTLALVDQANPTLVSATVAVTGNAQPGEDVLAFQGSASTGNIVAAGGTGGTALTLSSAGNTATLGQWQAALDAVTYTDTAVTPNTATRTVSFTVTDASVSATATRDITVAATDQTPIVTLAGTPVTDGLSATPLTVALNPALAVSDADNPTLASASVSIGSGFTSGDILGFTSGSASGNIAAAYNAATGVLTLASSGATATLAQWQAALDAVTFETTSTTTGDRTIDVSVSDGVKTSALATDVVHVVQGASLGAAPSPVGFVAANNAPSTPVDIEPFLFLADNYASLQSATVAVTGNFHAGEDVLAFAGGPAYGNITATYNAATGVLTLTSAGATASLGQWQNALASVTYTDTAVTPNTATRTITFTATDGTTTSLPITQTVTVADTDQSPIVTTAGSTVAYVSGRAAVTIDPGVTVSDLDNTTLANADVAITSGFHAGDTLAFAASAATGNITASYNPTFGNLLLFSQGSTATLAQWQAALDAITFSSTSTASGNRTISFIASDGTALSTVATDTVDVLHGPNITTGSATLTYLANAAATSLGTITVTDPDSPTLVSATVSIGSGFAAGDQLAFTASSSSGNIAGAYNSGTGVLSLVSAGGTATLAQWQAALDAITFSGTVGGTRTIRFAANDGATLSAAITETINVLPSTSSGSTVTITSPITVPASLTLPPGPIVISAPAATPVTVAITAGGVVKAGGTPITGTAGIDLASTAGSSAAVTVAGAGATLDADGARLTVGDHGAATLTVSGGGIVRSGANYADTEAALAVGSSAGSSGTLIVTGQGSELIATGAAVIGGNLVASGTPLAGAAAFGSTQSASSSPSAGGQGTVTVTNGATLQTGAMTIEAGSSLTVDSLSALITPSITLQGGTANLATASAATPITFGTGGILDLHALSGADVVNNFNFGDTIDLVGIQVHTGIATTVTTGGGTLTLNAASGVTAYMSSDGNGGTLVTPTSQTIGIYRFFDTETGVHLYTSSLSEVQAIEQTRPDETFEGVGLTALTPANNDPNAVPIYRFFDTTDGTPFYTASAAERDNLIATRPDMTYEPSSVFYEHLTAQPGDVAVYRFFDTTNGTHFYTDSAAESANISATRTDLKAEGIAFYEAPHTAA